MPAAPQHDIDHLAPESWRQTRSASTKMDVHHDWALLALQGPQAGASAEPALALIWTVSALWISGHFTLKARFRL